MCLQTLTTFRCSCPQRNTPLCPHHIHLVPHLHIALESSPAPGFAPDGSGWRLRWRPEQPQGHKAWDLVEGETTWTRCGRYKLVHGVEHTGEEERCPGKEVRRRVRLGACGECVGGHEAGV